MESSFSKMFAKHFEKHQKEFREVTKDLRTVPWK